VTLEGFSKAHITHRERNLSVGGSGDIAMLFSQETILCDFPGFEVLKLEEKEVFFQEDKYHQGIR
jgi:hypothetical protein